MISNGQRWYLANEAMFALLDALKADEKDKWGHLKEAEDFLVRLDEKVPDVDEDE